MFPVVMMDDYPLVVLGVEMMLRPWREQFHVLVPPITTITTNEATVVLYDPTGRPQHEIRRASELISTLCEPRVLIYTWKCTPHQAHHYISSGAAGVISKRLPATRLAEAILKTHGGLKVVEGIGDASLRPSTPPPPPRLSPRERAVLQAIGEHRPNVDIAADLGLSLNTVKGYIRNTYTKLGVRTRAEAVAWLYTTGNDDAITTRETNSGL